MEMAFKNRNSVSTTKPKTKRSVSLTVNFICVFKGHFNEADAEYLNQGGYFRFENILSALDSPVNI